MHARRGAEGDRRLAADRPDRRVRCRNIDDQGQDAQGSARGRCIAAGNALGRGKDGRMKDEEPVRHLSRHETHDLSMIIRERAKVLKACVEEEAASRMADFEQQISTVYKFDQDDVWRKATEEAQAVVAKANETIQDRCRKLGIPAQY